MNDDAFALGETLFSSARIENAGADTVTVSRATIVATPGACGATGGVPQTLAQASALELEAGAGYEMQGQRVLDEDFTLGHWCARVQAQNSTGETVDLGDPIAFDIVEASGDASSTVIARDLGYWTADSGDAGFDAGIEPPGRDPEPGCACSAPGRSLGASWLALLVLGGGVFLRRRVFGR